MNTQPRSTWPLAVGVIVALSILYVASYPLAVRISRPPLANISGYQPVEWLIDNTPFEYVMCNWASVFGVREEVLFCSAIRKLVMDLEYNQISPTHAEWKTTPLRDGMFPKEQKSDLD